MTFGINEQGIFTKKRLADILANIINRTKDEIDAAAELTPDTPEGQIISIFSDELSQVWDGLEAVYYASYRHQAFGDSLDFATSNVGVSRKGANFTNVNVRFYGVIDTVIGINKIVSKSSDESKKFVTKESKNIVAGPKEVQKISYINAASGNFKISYNGEQTTALPFDVDTVTVYNSLLALSSLENEIFIVTSEIDGFLISFQESKRISSFIISDNTLKDASLDDVNIEIERIVKGDLDHAEVLCQAQVEGAITATALSIDKLESTINGVNSVLNIVDGDTGLEIESDAAYTRRADESLAIGGASTIEAIRARLRALSGVKNALVFENTDITTNSIGIPAGHIFCVVDGGDDDEIASEIWLSKGGGTPLFGNLSIDTLDGDKNVQTVKFSRPTKKEIFVKINITKNLNYPTNGDDLVKAAIISFGESLTIGQKIIVYPKMISSISNIAGIEDVEIFIGFLENPTLSDNLSLTVYEVGEWLESNIEVLSA